MKITILLLILTAYFSAFGQFQKPSASKIKAEAAATTISEVQEALRSFDFNRLSINPNNLTPQDIEYLRSNFLGVVKPYLIEEGGQVRRLRNIAEPVLRLHNADKSQTIVFDNRVPTVFTWKETFITFSSGAMDILSDDEIAALIAHEIGHLYFAEALAKARAEGDDRLTRIIELECDLVASTTLSKLGIKPSALISAVKKLVKKRSQAAIESFQPGSPSLEDREEILDAFLKRTKDNSNSR